MKQLATDRKIKRAKITMISVAAIGILAASVKVTFAVGAWREERKFMEQISEPVFRAEMRGEVEKKHDARKAEITLFLKEYGEKLKQRVNRLSAFEQQCEELKNEAGDFVAIEQKCNAERQRQISTGELMKTDINERSQELEARFKVAEALFLAGSSKENAHALFTAMKAMDEPFSTENERLVLARLTESDRALDAISDDFSRITKEINRKRTEVANNEKKAKAAEATAAQREAEAVNANYLKEIKSKEDAVLVRYHEAMALKERLLAIKIRLAAINASPSAHEAAFRNKLSTQIGQLDLALADGNFEELRKRLPLMEASLYSIQEAGAKGFIHE